MDEKKILITEDELETGVQFLIDISWHVDWKGAASAIGVTDKQARVAYWNTIIILARLLDVPVSSAPIEP